MKPTFFSWEWVVANLWLITQHWQVKWVKVHFFLGGGVCGGLMNVPFIVSCTIINRQPGGGEAPSGCMASFQALIIGWTPWEEMVGVLSHPKPHSNRVMWCMLGCFLFSHRAGNQVSIFCTENWHDARKFVDRRMKYPSAIECPQKKTWQLLVAPLPLYTWENPVL